MKHSMKRLLSLLLALIFCVSLFPAALAEEPGETADGRAAEGGGPYGGDAGEIAPAEGPDALSLPSEIQSGEAFTTQPVGGSIYPDGTLTISWKTNFTPTKVEIGGYISGNYSAFYVIEENLSTSMSEDILYGWCQAEMSVRAYYSDTFGLFVESDTVQINIVPHQFTQQPVGGTIYPDGTLTISWKTNFTPTKVEIGGYYDGDFIALYVIEENLSTSMSKEISYDLCKEEMTVRAYYTGIGGVKSSETIQINIVPRQFTQQPVGGTIYPGGTLKINWKTNFTPTKVEIGWFEAGYYFVSYVIEENLSTSMSKEISYDLCREEMTVRAYYNGIGGVKSSETIQINKVTNLGEFPCGDDLLATLSSDGVLTITGTGPMWYFEEDDPGYYPYREEITSVVIESGMTSIGVYAFYNLTNLSSVTLPDTLTTIGSRSFQKCGSLRNVTIPASVTGIGYGAFMNSGLASIAFLGSAPTIGNNAFQGCSLTAYYPAGDESWTAGVRQDYGGTVNWVTSGLCGDDVYWTLSNDYLSIVGSGAMYNYTSASAVPWNLQAAEIKRAVIGSGVTTVARYGFSGCTALESVTIPEGITTIGAYAFRGCSSLRQAAIPSSCTTLGVTAFGGCSSLAGVTLSDGVKTLGAGVFLSCSSLESVTIPGSVTKIASQAFSGCSSLKEISFEGSAPSFANDREFKGVTATAYYPGNDATWTEEVRQDYGGTITWVACEPVQAPIITKQPADQTVAVGQTASFSVEATGADLSYQWYYQKPGSEAWNAVTAAAGKQATYTLSTAARHNGYRYKCVVTNSAGSAESSVAVLTVYAKPVILTQPADQTVTVGQTAGFSVEAEGLDLSYKWYYRTSSEASWKATSAASGKTANYSLTAEERHNGYQYRCKVTNPAGSVYTQAVTLTVNPAAKPVIVTQPQSVTGEIGKTVHFTVAAEGAGLSYQWYYRLPGTTAWKAANATSAKTADYSLKPAERHNGYQYRCKVKNDAGYVYTKTVTLTVAGAAPVIQTQPKGASVTVGTKASFTVKAVGTELSYQWQYRTGETGAWKNVSTASGKTAKYTLTAAERHNGYQYQCVVTNPQGSVTSAIATLTVTAAS